MNKLVFLTKHENIQKHKFEEHSERRCNETMVLNDKSCMKYEIDFCNDSIRLTIVWKELEVFNDKYETMWMTQMQNKFSKDITIGGSKLIKIKEG